MTLTPCVNFLAEEHSVRIEWKNTPDLYNDYCYLEECPRPMQTLLSIYGWFFDDLYFYWKVKHRKGGPSQIVKRRPLYWWPQKMTPAEKPKDPFQKKLELRK